jgi:signal transduction histidine kinase
MYYPTPLLPNPAELEFIRQAAEIAAAAIDRKMLERDLDQARIRAEEASLAKSRFLANMSHELRTPLNAVIGFSELMASGMLQGEVKRYQDYAVEVVRSAHELLSLISSLLDAANLQQGEYELHEDVIDPASLIHICLKEKSDWARRRGVVLGFEPPDAAPTLSADFDSVHKVIGKILDNALKHTPQGGVIDIGMSLKPAGELVISIRDSGEGIKEEDLSRIVHPFEQGGFASAYLARRYGGAGLGLAISHMLMQLHGGNVALKSEPGKGTLAEIIFPPSRVTAGGMI